MEKKKLEDMISAHAYNEIKTKLEVFVGKEAVEYVFPALKMALEEGSGEMRENILIGWLNMDSVRVCSHCGKIMEEGWYLDYNGYACSDECCMKLMNVDKDEFDRYKIYKPEIEEFLADEGKGRTLESLTAEEIDDITCQIVSNLDAYFYTEWY